MLVVVAGEVGDRVRRGRSGCAAERPEGAVEVAVLQAAVHVVVVAGARLRFDAAVGQLRLEIVVAVAAHVAAGRQIAVAVQQRAVRELILGRNDCL